MKHLFLSIALLCALSTISQETEKTIKKNELKKAPNFTSEYSILKILLL